MRPHGMCVYAVYCAPVSNTYMVTVMGNIES